MNLFLCIPFLVVLVVAHKLSDKENRLLWRNCGRHVAGYNSAIPHEWQTAGGDDDTFKVLYGESVSSGAAPWVASIATKMDRDISMRFGGHQKYLQHGTGTLISPRHVVTAAHLVGLSESPTPDCKTGHLSSAYFMRKPDVFTVFLNVTCATPSHCAVRNRPDQFVPYEVKSVFVRKGYVGDGCVQRESFNDIAVFELDRDVKFSNDLFPACLPKTANMPLHGIRETRLFGFGRDASLSENDAGELRILRSSVQTCPKEFQQPGLFCTSSPSKGLSCDGDSGAGVVYTPPGSRAETLIGVLSAGVSCSDLVEQHRAEKRKGRQLTNASDILIDVSHHLEFFCECCGICRRS